jgi:hypothetical protein
MLLVWVVVRLTEDYPLTRVPSIAPETVQPGAYSSSLKAKVFSKLHVRDTIVPTSPCPLVNPGNGHVQHACRLHNRHQIVIPFISRHYAPPRTPKSDFLLTDIDAADIANMPARTADSARPTCGARSLFLIAPFVTGTAPLSVLVTHAVDVSRCVHCACSLAGTQTRLRGAMRVPPELPLSRCHCVPSLPLCGS